MGSVLKNFTGITIRSFSFIAPISFKILNFAELFRVQLFNKRKRYKDFTPSQDDGLNALQKFNVKTVFLVFK